MDFMKVVDQAVREIKREVNLKVLKVPEIEQKVLDATDNEPWGPHGSALAEIAQATKKFTECQMIMNVLWTRLGETGKDWRYVYKALAVIEYLIANGSERAVDEIIEHTFQISSLTSFEYVEPNGKDAGINVRKKAENIVTLLNNKDKIEETRKKAASTREKYVGLSSTGISYKSSSASYSGSSFQNSNRYGGFSGRYDDDSYKTKDEDHFGEDKFDKYVPKSHQGASAERKTSYHSSRNHDLPSTGQKSSSGIKTDEYAAISHQNANLPSTAQVDDDDDFDPRGTAAKTEPAAASSQQMDLFGESLIGDLLDTPTTIPSQSSAMGEKSSDVDLFGDADFVSAAPQVEAGGSLQTQPNVDLFAAQSVSANAQPLPSAAVSSTMDFFAASDQVAPTATKTENIGSSNVNFVDPFAAIPLNSFEGSNLLGTFTSHTDQSSLESTENLLKNNSVTYLHGKSLSESKAPQKGNFQVKSGIWADSLSRGLIDLNISAPKKVNLTEIGIVGGLSDGSEDKQKAAPTSYYMGSAMGMGTGFGGTGSNPTTTGADDFFSSFTSSSQYQYGGFQK
ncbi:clathrin interactor EPSIN 1 isoform X1 [Amaranthus tricolor]|uniref:clathrin interactor EPSIN 1 isoform X1 n=1 Tax=Amaranthus tricolor TaxID=29722 RepID=UPI002589FDAF|nr:clathrin interactor EPSIN 1 isoform X1 [Amaranthus tricolor]XP_057524205.1 clathrin interactor EPSIN 1 isoform X1 [Amaranthus tricolor]